VLALKALVEGKQKQEAAEAAGVHPNTVERWMRLPAFQVQLNRQVKELLQITSYQTARAVGEAMRVLSWILEADLPARVKLQAAEIVLQHRPEIVELNFFLADRRRDVRISCEFQFRRINYDV
jgi:hypothetical protein